MSNVNRNATDDEMANVASAIRAAYPDLEPVFGGHSAYGGHRAPRDHSISFRLRDHMGKYHSNVIWIMPQYLSTLTPGNIRWLVAHANGDAKVRKRKRRKRR